MSDGPTGAKTGSPPFGVLAPAAATALLLTTGESNTGMGASGGSWPEVVRLAGRASAAYRRTAGAAWSEGARPQGAKEGL